MFGFGSYLSSPAQDVVLSEGAVERMRTDASTSDHPVLQVVAHRAIQAVPSAGHPPPATRYRLTLSDGRHYMMALLASQLAHLVEGGTLATGSIVRLLDFAVTSVHDKRLIVILNLELVSPPRAIVNEDHLESIDQQSQASTPSAAPFPASPSYSTHSPSFNLSALASALPKTPAKSVFTFGAAASPPASTAPPPSSGFDLSPLAAVLPRTSGSTHASPFRSTPPRLQASPKADDVGVITSVADLNPYLSRWTIRVKVTSKGDVKHYQTARGPGKLLAIDLMDVAGTEIRAVMFNEAVDKFESIIQQGNVYSIEKATLKVANKKFSHINNDYEITISPASVVEAVADTFPGLVCHFAPLSDIREKKADDLLNTIDLEKRSLALSSREVSVELTLWGQAAASFEGSAGDVLGLKSVKVSEWQETFVLCATERMKPAMGYYPGKSLGATQASSYGSSRLFPARRKHKAEAVKTIQEIKALDVSGGSAFVVVNATVAFIKYDISGNTYYRSCPNESCARKVVDVGGSYRCEMCNASYDHCQYRYVMSVRLIDHTDSLWATVFNDVGATLLGVPASEVADICENRSDQRALEEVMNRGLLHKWRLKLRVAEESWGNFDKRIRATIMSAEPLNYAASASDVTSSISRLLAQQ
ncbi:replication factora protein 1 (rpa1) subfamily protein [Acanthamoeba castellanii str. Neff]|uniref:Replication factora protein 1 (Rpa1) subfamily protein n=1 Tax=Acanthamoeba castellanii (strain ATCC 30010 / Neff) TaxID=1257118 RepID=L8GZQ4_ACACF|nr:replication factora protein 1 (rpa1) subfamily protein [Acanthamoeba castellanii str. Neff]ELR18729.1 replication factora protein 1 (rpa1) subfamily protein [Acanthamoeba castellanii str. Neff]